MISKGLQHIDFQVGGTSVLSHMFRPPFLGPEVTQEWQEVQRRELCGQLGTVFLISKAREKVIATRHALSEPP